MEHHQAVLESLESDHPPLQVLLSLKLYEKDPERWQALAQRPGVDWFLVEHERLDRVVSVPGVEGVCGVYEPRRYTLESLTESTLFLVLWEVQDPGNVGTIVRTCGALVPNGVVICVGGCNPWSSKVARASAGTIFRVPVVSLATDEGVRFLDTLEASGVSVYAAAAHGGSPLSSLEWASERVAIVLGNESHGLPELPTYVRPFTIPVSAGVESLNVGVSSAIVCYERGRGGR